MKYKWLNKKENSKLIIFFNGWGMDEFVINHFECGDYDVLMFYDYNTLKTDFNFDSLNIYPKKYLVAWSMGVMIATLFDIDYISKTAINGTLKPIDDEYGIPKRIYNLTLKGFSPKGAEKFIKNMFNNDLHLTSTLFSKGEGDVSVKITNREFENQKSELEALTHYKAKEDFKYDRIIISKEDKIIPTKNQSAFWRIEPNLESGHCPFYHFKKWSELL